MNPPLGPGRASPVQHSNLGRAYRMYTPVSDGHTTWSRMNSPTAVTNTRTAPARRDLPEGTARTMADREGRRRGGVRTACRAVLVRHSTGFAWPRPPVPDLGPDIGDP